MATALTGVTAVAFDVNGTLVHIRTDEHREDIFRSIGHFLTYQGIDMRRHEVRDEYFGRLKRQQRESPHQYPEFDAVAIWRSIVEDYASDYTRELPPERLAQLPLTLAEIYRGVSRKKLKLYPHVREVLEAVAAKVSPGDRHRCSNCLRPWRTAQGGADGLFRPHHRFR